MGLYFEKGWDDPSNHESSVTKSGIEAIFDHWDANGHHDMRDKARKGRVDLFVRKDYSGYYHATEVSKSRWL